ncbi:hypothetical protein AB6A23_09650 [Paenibacillus tarimensis]
MKAGFRGRERVHETTTDDFNNTGAVCAVGRIAGDCGGNRLI